MAKFCSNCGTEVAENASFCSECGARLTFEDNTEPLNSSAEYTEEQYTEQAFEEQPTVAQPQVQYIPAATPAPEVDDSRKVVGVGAFFGLEVLFALPLIGWIICIVMAFAPKNQNMKNFARAKLIWIVISTVISLLLAVGLLALFTWLIGTAESMLYDLMSDPAYALNGIEGFVEDIILPQFMY